MIEFPPQNGVRFIKNVMIPMADGVEAAMDMYVPVGPDGEWRNTAHPLILEYIPYRKDDTHPYTGYHNYFAQHGFIGARLDCRGTGSSGGVNKDEYVPQEQQDGYDAIEWIAKQSWSTGKIAMFGSSYGGFTAVQIAALQPPHLTTIIPTVFTDDRYTDDCHYRGGAMRCYYDVGFYGSMMIGMNAMPPYPEYSGDTWAETWDEHLEHNEPYLLTWLENQLDGQYWRPGSLTGRYDKVKCSAFLIGGWRDGYPNPPLRTFRNLKSPAKVMVGPWNHTRPNMAIPGPRIDYLHEVARWCDYWLKGEQNGVMDEPPVQVYMQTYDRPDGDRLETTGYWRAERTSPVEGAKDWTLYLDEGGTLRAQPTASSPSTPSDSYEYRPTVGIAGGLWSGGVPFGLPTDQRIDDAYSLTYDTEQLTEEVEIMGQPRAVLHVSSTAPVMAFVARLSDVAPDGTVALICNGVLNATRRESMTEPSALTPGEVYELDIALDDTAWRFRKGHRIRLSVCSADFPNLWPTPYNGVNEIYRDAVRRSSLTLSTVPVRPEMKDEIAYLPSPTPTEVYTLPPNENPWEIMHDILGDRTGLRMKISRPARANKTTEVTTTFDEEVWASNRNPGDVVATGKILRHIVRQDGITDVDTCTVLRSTETEFHLTVDLEVRVNDMPHHQKRWMRTYKRELM